MDGPSLTALTVQARPEDVVARIQWEEAEKIAENSYYIPRMRQELKKANPGAYEIKASLGKISLVPFEFAKRQQLCQSRMRRFALEFFSAAGFAI
jgi:hypothetical protein